MFLRKYSSSACLVLVVVSALSSVARGQVTTVNATDTQAYFGSLNDAYQASNPTGLNPWPAAGPNAPAFYGTVNQLPGVPSPPGGNVAPTNASPFWPFNATSFFNDGNGNTASSAISAFVAGNTGTADDAQIGLFMTLNQTTGGYAYEQINYVVDFNVSSLVNATGTAGTLPGLVSRSYTVSGSVGTAAGSFVAFGGQMNFWDGATNASLGPPLLFNYFNSQTGAFTATVNASSFINAVNWPSTLRITGDFFLIGDPSTITVTSVPEPSALALLGSAILCIVATLGRSRFARTLRRA
jgi:hypothetical protein